jgi:glycosyltransferase involved in cell wall biosynthesis
LRKLLIISYYWPPAGGPGVQRWLKFTKYLRDFGVEPYILTVDENEASYPALDHSLQKEIPEGMNVYKTNSFEPLKIFSSLFKKEKVPYAGIPDRDKMSFTGKLALFLRANLFIPDARKGWNRYAYKKASEIIDEENISTVITTGPPHSTHLIGLKLKKNKKITWLADMRDPWTDIYYYDKLHHTALAKKTDAAYEKSVLTTADKVIVTSEETAKLFSGKTDASSQNKISVITNGYDEADFEGVTAIAEKEFTITFIGTISMQFGIEGFVKAFKSVINNHPQIPMHLKFVGKMDEQTKSFLLANFKKELNLIGYVSHKEAISHSLTAQVLLLVIPQGNNEGTVPGKTFEYLATKNPVLCISPPNSSAGKIIEYCKGGKTFAHNDTEAIAGFIEELFIAWQSGKNNYANNTIFKEYSRKNQTGLLAKLLNS